MYGNRQFVHAYYLAIGRQISLQDFLAVVTPKLDVKRASPSDERRTKPRAAGEHRKQAH